VAEIEIPPDPIFGGSGIYFASKVADVHGCKEEDRMFEQQSPSPLQTTLNEPARKAIRRATVAGFVMCAVYLLLGVFLLQPENDNAIVACVVLGVAALFFVGGILAINQNTSGARVCWLIGGFVGLPLGLVMVAFANLMKAAITKAEAEALEPLL
jgi:hypothetical protein